MGRKLKAQGWRLKAQGRRLEAQGCSLEAGGWRLRLEKEEEQEVQRKPRAPEWWPESSTFGWPGFGHIRYSYTQILSERAYH